MRYEMVLIIIKKGDKKKNENRGRIIDTPKDIITKYGIVIFFFHGMIIGIVGITLYLSYHDIGYLIICTVGWGGKIFLGFLLPKKYYYYLIYEKGIYFPKGRRITKKENDFVLYSEIVTTSKKKKGLIKGVIVKTKTGDEYLIIHTLVDKILPYIEKYRENRS